MLKAKTGPVDPRPVRQRDGAVLRCPDHADGPLYRGYTLSGQLKTWCTVHGCSWVAQWLPPEDNQ